MSKNGRDDELPANRIPMDIPDSDADLPPADTRRWVPRRKAEVVAAVDEGVLTASQACERYELSMEELESWRAMAHRHGLKGLRVTRLQKYQDRPLKRAVATT